MLTGDESTAARENKRFCCLQLEFSTNCLGTVDAEATRPLRDGSNIRNLCQTSSFEQGFFVAFLGWFS